MLTLGLFIDFKDAVQEGEGDPKDAVHEGEGDPMLLIWKYLLLSFRATGRKNYAIEALTLLLQYHVTLPCNLAEQLKWFSLCQ